MPRSFHLLLLALALLPACRETPPEDPEPTVETETPPTILVPDQVEIGKWRYSDWFNDSLRAGMTLDQVETLLGPDHSRDEEGESFNVDYIYEDEESDPPEGAVVGITLYFVNGILDGWICSVHRKEKASS